MHSLKLFLQYFLICAYIICHCISEASGVSKYAVPAQNNNLTFHNPILDESWPDPYCHHHTDFYYYMPRREDDRRGIGLFRSRKLSDWRNAEKAVVLRAPDGLMSLWAPEIHFIDGNFYLYYALDDGNNVNHRMYVSHALDPNNPMGNYSVPKRITVPGDDFWAIDTTVLQYGPGQMYLIWSGWPTLRAEFPQNIYIALMCNPETLCSERKLIAEPIYSWERNGAPLLEGPQILKRFDRIFLLYSGSGSWTPDYNLGMMWINGLADPMNATNWHRHNESVFWRNDEENVFGVGHASFTTSPDFTEEWIVYHAMENPDAGWDGRTSRIERFSWNSENFPVFKRPAGFQNAIPVPSGEF